jgi:hypothetical protein
MAEGMSNVTPQTSLRLVNEFLGRPGISEATGETTGARALRGFSDSGHIKALSVSQIIGGDTIEGQKTPKEKGGALGITAHRSPQ